MTTVALNIIADGHSESFPHFTGYIPFKGDSVVYYSKIHDGCQYSGIVVNVHHVIQFEHQNDVRVMSTNQVITVTISNKRIH